MTNLKSKIKKIQETLKSEPDFNWLDALIKAYPLAEIFLVGGQVRDLIIGRQSDDFDFVIRNLSAQQVEDFLTQHGTINLVGKSFGVFIFRPTISGITQEIEIALPRTDKSFNTGGYRDFEIQTDPNLPIEEDLKRRDFTINAIAMNIITGEIIDPFSGQEDVEKKIIRAVGDPLLRFGEDYTRMLRAVRFASQLLFKIEDKTFEAIKQMASKIKDVPAERIQVDLNKIMLSKNVEHAFELLKETGMLQFILPEIAEGIDVHQGKAHIYPVFEHLIKAADHASKRGYSLPIVLGALFHDSGKPRTKAGDPISPTFYQHEYVGEKMTKEALARLKYPKDTIKKAAHLVRNHMFYYNMGEVTDAGIRRLIAKVGPDNIDDLIRLRIADRLGMGRPKAKPFKLVELERRVKIMQTAPITVQMLAIDGHDIMGILKIKPSIRIKHLQNALLNEVLENPELNAKDILVKRLNELNKLSDQDLAKLSPDFQEVESERKRDLLKGFKGVD